MVDSYVLDTIPFQISWDQVLERTHVEPGSEYAQELGSMMEAVHAVGRPKTFFTVDLVEPNGYDRVLVRDREFKSRILRVNLDQTHRVFPFVATCGTELDEWSKSFDDLLQRFWADTFKELVLESTYQYLHQHIQDRFQTVTLAGMNPGSLEDWPITEQPKLFSLLGDTREKIGVYLTESSLMIPTKSISGILFPTEEEYSDCQLCPKDPCSGRRVPYDPELYDKKYR